MFTNVAQSYRIAQEEIFGPVLSVLTFRTPAEAVEKANNTPYGLSAGIWTEKGSRILWMAERLRAGVVWANTYNRFDPASPFGGYKESGFGREGGRHGLEPYLEFDRESAAHSRRCHASRRVTDTAHFLLRSQWGGGRERLALPPEQADGMTAMSRLPVKKTYKLYVGGAFPRSESGRTYLAEGQNVARASRKDLRDAVRAARAAQPAGRAPPRTTAARWSTGSPRCWRHAAPSSRSSAPAKTRSTARSTASSGTRAGPTSSRR